MKGLKAITLILLKKRVNGQSIPNTSFIELREYLATFNLQIGVAFGFYNTLNFAQRQVYRANLWNYHFDERMILSMRQVGVQFAKDNGLEAVNIVSEESW